MPDPSLFAEIRQLAERHRLQHQYGPANGWRERIGDVGRGLRQIGYAVAFTAVLALAGGFLLLIPIEMDASRVFGPEAGDQAAIIAVVAVLIVVLAWMIGRDERCHAHADASRADLVTKIEELAERGISAEREASTPQQPEPEAAARRRFGRRGIVGGAL